MIGFGMVVVSPSVAAQPVTFEQQIKPIECVYTAVTTGGAPNTTTNCNNQPLPVVTTVTVNGTHVVIVGHFVAADTRILRLWIAGQAYVLGSDAELTAAGDTWVLDLQILHAGKYAVTLEAETNDNYLLRNVDAATFTVTTSGGTVPSQPNVPIDTEFGGESTYGNGFLTIPALPGAGELDTPSVINVPPPSIDTQAGEGRMGQHTLMELVVAAIIIVPLISICIGLIIRSRRP